MKLSAPVVWRLSELAFAQRAASLGYDIYSPLVGTQKGCDLVAFKDGQFSRVQVKTASLRTHKGTDQHYVSSTLCGTATIGRKRQVAMDEYDHLALVCAELGTVWLIPRADVTQSSTITKSVPKLADWDQYRF